MADEVTSPYHAFMSREEFYRKRIRRVLMHIGAHLDEELSVEQLSAVAGFSKYHFHRQFTAYTGQSVGKMVAMMRLKYASFQLAFAPEQRIAEVAEEAGFEAPESFSRAFAKVQGQCPTEFRAAPAWEQWTDAFRTDINTQDRTMDMKIVEFPETHVAVLEHRGAPAALLGSVQRFIAWRKSCNVSPNQTSQTYGLVYDDPEKTEPAAFRFDICGSTQVPVPENAFGVIAKTIPGGRCAVARHLGSTDAIGETVLAMYKEWLPKSGEELRDFPLFFHYIKRMPEVTEHEQVTDVYLPLAPMLVV